MNLALRNSQPFLFLGALGVYAVFSSPTPDDLGGPEILIALLLLSSVRIGTVRENLVAMSALVLGFCVPLVTALIRGQEFIDIVRDIIPFLFLFMPLFYQDIFKGREHLLPVAVTSVGLVFALRTVWAYRESLFSPSLWGQGPPVDLLYLANSPEVLFSSLFCFGTAGRLLVCGQSKLKSVGVACLSVLPLIAMALMTQRAGLGAFFLTVIIWISGLFYFRPKMSLGVIGILGGICLLFWPFLQNVFLILWQKTELVGLNSRAQEWEAVLRILTENGSNLLFGTGWGGRIENPAVGGLNVNYTHSLLSSLLLKTGILGALVILFGAMGPVYLTARQVVLRAGKVDYILFGAVLSPFLISSVLYASYKSLGFGLILLVFSSFLPRKLEKNPADVQ